MSQERGPRPRSFRLALRIYLAALLPLAAVSLIIGVLDIFAIGPPLPTPPAQPGPGMLLFPVGLALFFLSIVSVLFARSLVKPITHLASTAAAFGAGDLDARANLQRTDELGDLSRQFDEMADRITHLMRLQKELLANVSHELRTPLARIRVVLDILDLEAFRDKAPEVLGITDDLKELEQLVGNIMMTARLDLEAGRAGQASLPLHLEQTDPQKTLNAAITRFRQKFPSRKLEVALEPSLPHIVADAMMVRRVINNLLDNARKYSGEMSVVTLRASGDDENLRVEVVDQGIGIAPDDIERVFRPFFRTDQSRARATGGVGLGLALSRHIVEAHEGTISIESKEGRGTTVSFSIPAI